MTQPRPEPTSRRRFLGSAALFGGGAAVGAAAGAAVGVAGGLWLARPRRPSLPPVKVAADRVTRILVGLRPFRPAGFRVEREEAGGKTLIHNYGHGGGGITLSWGSAHLAVAELAKAGPLPAAAAVIGAGVIGLSTARLLQARGVAVTVYARDLPPATTSNIAAGKWLPFGVAEAPSDAFRAQLAAAARFSHRYFQHFTGPAYGVRWLRSYNLGGHAPSGGASHLYPEPRMLARGDHPFDAGTVARYTTMMVETPVYLRALMADVRRAGGRIVVRTFADRAAALAVPEPAVFNCTGLGAKTLFGDETLTPVRGQLVALLPQPEIDYMVSHGDLYMMPRRDGILLGGTYGRGETSLTPDPAATAHMLEGHARLFGALA